MLHIKKLHKIAPAVFINIILLLFFHAQSWAQGSCQNFLNPVSKNSEEISLGMSDVYEFFGSENKFEVLEAKITYFHRETFEEGMWIPADLLESPYRTHILEIEHVPGKLQSLRIVEKDKFSVELESEIDGEISVEVVDALRSLVDFNPHEVLEVNESRYTKIYKENKDVLVIEDLVMTDPVEGEVSAELLTIRFEKNSKNLMDVKLVNENMIKDLDGNLLDAERNFMEFSYRPEKSPERVQEMMDLYFDKKSDDEDIDAVTIH